MPGFRDDSYGLLTSLSTSTHYPLPQDTGDPSKTAQWLPTTHKGKFKASPQITWLTPLLLLNARLRYQKRGVVSTTLIPLPVPTYFSSQQLSLPQIRVFMCMLLYRPPISPFWVLSPCRTPVHLFPVAFLKNLLRNSNSQKYLGRKVNWRPGKANELSEAVGAPHTSWSEAVTMSTVISISARVSSSHTELGSSDLRGGQ